MDDLKTKPDEYWKQKLTPEQYHIVREKGTEAPGTGVYLDNHEAGMYRCVACGNELFASDTKFESGSGWPSFTDPVNRENVDLHDDNSMGMHRVEVTCKRCGAHLGHVFDDGPADKETKAVNDIALTRVRWILSLRMRRIKHKHVEGTSFEVVMVQ